MRAIAAFSGLLLLACGEPQTEESESGLEDSTISAPESGGPEIVGVYQMVSLDGQPLPNKGLSSGLMEFRPDSTWGLSVSYTDLAVPATSSGGYAVGEITEQCYEVVTWPDGLPDHRDILNICDGGYSLDGSGWIATFEKGK